MVGERAEPRDIVRGKERHAVLIRQALAALYFLLNIEVFTLQFIVS